MVLMTKKYILSTVKLIKVLTNDTYLSSVVFLIAQNAICIPNETFFNKKLLITQS